MSTPLALALDTCCLSILPSTTQTEDTCRRRVRRDTRPLKLVRVKVQAVYPPPSVTGSTTDRVRNTISCTSAIFGDPCKISAKHTFRLFVPLLAAHCANRAIGHNKATLNT